MYLVGVNEEISQKIKGSELRIISSLLAHHEINVWITIRDNNVHACSKLGWAGSLLQACFQHRNLMFEENTEMTHTTPFPPLLIEV